MRAIFADSSDRRNALFGFETLLTPSRCVTGSFKTYSFKISARSVLARRVGRLREKLA